MSSIESQEAVTPVKRRKFWKRVQRRCEKIRYGREGRIIGYALVFTFITLLIFATIMGVGYYTTH